MRRIWGDAADGAKVVRPRTAGEDQWCSLTALNDLRRRDPVKASALWCAALVLENRGDGGRCNAERRFDKYFMDMDYFAKEAGPVSILGWKERSTLRGEEDRRLFFFAFAQSCAENLRKKAALVVGRLLDSRSAIRSLVWTVIIGGLVLFATPLKLLTVRPLWR